MTMYNRASVASKFALELNDTPGGWLHSAEGGHASSEMVVEKMGTDHLQRKHAGVVKYDDISLTFGTGMSRQLYNWVSASLKQDYKRYSGAIVTANFDHKETSRLNFYDALVSEIGLPALDAASKDPAKMSLKITPEYTVNKFRKQPGDSIAGKFPIDAKKQKRWLPSNFSLRIDGLEQSCRQVSKIESLVIKQKNVELSVGESRYLHREPANIEYPNLVLTLAERHAEQFYDWHESFIIQGKNDPSQEKTGTLEYLDADLKGVLFVCNFHHLGILKLTADKLGGEEIRKVKVEMYCESMSWDFKVAWD